MSAPAPGRAGGRWLMVALCAAAMAWLEAAVVFYLRLLMGGNMNPYQADPIPNTAGVAPAEIVREAATLVMLLAVGWLAGRTWRTRLGYTLVAFGVWDILYYVFLKVITGWPNALWDWDILFLIPLPWWGPVIAPAAIALLMVMWGTLVTQVGNGECPLASGWTVWVVCGIGVLLGLYVFMADALGAVAAGASLNDLRARLPLSFNWPLFVVAWALMAAPVLDVLRQLTARNRVMAADRSMKLD